MKHCTVLAVLMVILGLAAGPVSAVEWTGQVIAVYPDEQVFTLDKEGDLVELKLQPQATDELKVQYQRLNVGDTIRVEVDEQELLAMAIEILPPTIEFDQFGEPKAFESMEPKNESAKGGY